MEWSALITILTQSNEYRSSLGGVHLKFQIQSWILREILCEWIFYITVLIFPGYHFGIALHQVNHCWKRSSADIVLLYIILTALVRLHLDIKFRKGIAFAMHYISLSLNIVF